MVVLPSRKQKNEPDALLHNQAGLPMHHGEAEQSLCRTYADCDMHSQRTALMAVCCSTGTKDEDAAGWHQYMILPTCPPLQEGALPSFF